MSEAFKVDFIVCLLYFFVFSIDSQNRYGKNGSKSV